MSTRTVSNGQRVYHALIERVADDASEAGYHQPSDLPPLSEEDYAVIAQQYPDTVNEVTLNGETLARIWASAPVDILSTSVGIYFLTAMREGLLGALCYDVMTECETRAERAQARSDETYYGGSSMTHRERMMDEYGLRERNFR